MSEFIELWNDRPIDSPFKNDKELAEGYFNAGKSSALQSQWISVEDRLPEVQCVATYLNGSGKRRRIMAEYFRRYTVEANMDDSSEGVSEYCEEKDTYFYAEGWWERIDNWEDYSFIVVHEGEITHWMPLPSPPIEAKT